MVCLNEKLPINKFKMQKVMLNKLEEIIEHELWYLEGVKDEKKEKLKKSIIKEMKNNFESDHFIYLMIHDEHCTYKHNRGKNNGNFCCKKITKKGDKKKYLCRTHNKNHVPQKRITNTISNTINLDKSVNNNKYNTTNCITTKKEKPNNIELLVFEGDKLNNSNISKIPIIKKNNYKYTSTQLKGNSNYYKYNIYKRLILNKNGTYKTLIKEFPLLDFCINKIKNIKNKKYTNCYNLL